MAGVSPTPADPRCSYETAVLWTFSILMSMFVWGLHSDGMLLIFGSQPIILLYVYASSQKTYLQPGAPSEDSDQSMHSRTLIRILTGRILDSQEWKVSSYDNKYSDQTAGCTDWFESSLSAHIRWAHKSVNFDVTRLKLKKSGISLIPN